MEKKKESLTNLAVLLFGILVAFVLLEGTVRLTLGNKLITATEPDGLYYFEPNQDGWYTPGFPRVRINNLSHRGEDVENIDEQYVIAFLGDSVTFGWLLEEEETIPYYFEKEIGNENVAVLNMSMGGYGIDHMKKRFLQSKKNHKIDFMFVILIDDDFLRVLDPNVHTPTKQLFWQVRKFSSFVALLYDSTKRFFSSGNEVPRKQEMPKLTEENKEKIIELAKLAEETDTIFVFYEMKKSEFSEVASEFCKAKELRCITDVYTIIGKIPENERYASDKAHPSAKANKALVKHLAGYFTAYSKHTQSN